MAGSLKGKRMAKTEIGKQIAELVEGLDKLVTDVEKDVKKVIEAGKKLKGQLEIGKDKDKD